MQWYEVVRYMTRGLYTCGLWVQTIYIQGFVSCGICDMKYGIATSANTKELNKHIGTWDALWWCYQLWDQMFLGIFLHACYHFYKTWVVYEKENIWGKCVCFQQLCRLKQYSVNLIRLNELMNILSGNLLLQNAELPVANIVLRQAGKGGKRGG